MRFDGRLPNHPACSTNQPGSRQEAAWRVGTLTADRNTNPPGCRPCEECQANGWVQVLTYGKSPGDAKQQAQDRNFQQPRSPIGGKGVDPPAGQKARQAGFSNQ